MLNLGGNQKEIVYNRINQNISGIYGKIVGIYAYKIEK